jgi:hypothetical protein
VPPALLEALWEAIDRHPVTLPPVPAPFAAGVSGRGRGRQLAKYNTMCYSSAMRLTFIETGLFRVSTKGLLSDDNLRSIGDTLLKRPEAGALIPRAGGARKIRQALQGRG